jgi:hypothetical protein
MGFLLFLLYGFAAGFLLVRLSRKRERDDREWKLLLIAGRVLASASLALAAMLLALMILRI